MSSKKCIIWVNLGNKFGDSNIHISSLDDIDQHSIRLDVMPQEVFDGLFCINETKEGRQNFSILKYIVLIKDLDLAPENGEHPLLTQQYQEIIKNKSINYYNDLQNVKMLYIDQDFNQASLNIDVWSEKLRDFVNKSR